MSSERLASLYMVNLDCADPRAMASFYSALLGWEMPYCEDDTRWSRMNDLHRVRPDRRLHPAEMARRRARQAVPPRFASVRCRIGGGRVYEAGSNGARVPARRRPLARDAGSRRPPLLPDARCCWVLSTILERDREDAAVANGSPTPRRALRLSARRSVRPGCSRRRSTGRGGVVGFVAKRKHCNAFLATTTGIASWSARSSTRSDRDGRAQRWKPNNGLRCKIRHDRPAGRCPTS